jgi:hypothetical protein
MVGGHICIQRSIATYGPITILLDVCRPRAELFEIPLQETCSISNITGYEQGSDSNIALLRSRLAYAS